MKNSDAHDTQNTDNTDNWYSRDVKNRLRKLGIRRKFNLPKEALKLLDVYYIETRTLESLKNSLFCPLSSLNIPAIYRDYTLGTGQESTKSYRVIWQNKAKERYFCPENPSSDPKFWLSYRGFRDFNFVLIQPILSKEEIELQIVESQIKHRGEPESKSTPKWLKD